MAYQSSRAMISALHLRCYLLLLRMLTLFLTACSTACSDSQPDNQPGQNLSIPGADPERGKAAIKRYGCVACHSIPGIGSHGSNVGPPLDKIAKRAYVAGVLPNTPTEMVRWLRNPPQIDPATAMPNMGISEAEAKDIAAYLYTLD